MKSIAINGFGRIGKSSARVILQDFADRLDLKVINSSAGAEKVAYMLKYDSTYGNLNDMAYNVVDEVIQLNYRGKEHRIKVISERDPSKIDWKGLEVEQVLECTGAFRKLEGESGCRLHLDSGAKKVIISAPAKSDDIETVVLGCGNNADGAVISNASCTTNCIAPVLKMINDKWKIDNLSGITVHAMTSSQELLDGYNKKDFRDGRSAVSNIIPTKTGAAKAVELVVPELAGKTSLVAARVPVTTGSMVFLTVRFKEDIEADENLFNKYFEKQADTEFKGIIEYSEEYLVSSDIIGKKASAIIDSKLTKWKNNTLELTLWYDNEWGYSNRLVELAAK